MCVVWFGLVWDVSYVGQAGLALPILLTAEVTSVRHHTPLWAFLFFEVCFVFVF